MEVADLINDAITWFKSMYTASELKIMVAGSAVGACFSAAVGGIDVQMQYFIYLVIIDYATGLFAGWKTKKLSSQRGFKGLMKKVAIFAAIALCFTIDQAAGIKILKDTAMFGFAVAEGFSIFENVDRAGYGWLVPYFIRNKLIQIQDEKGVKLNG